MTAFVSKITHSLYQEKFFSVLLQRNAQSIQITFRLNTHVVNTVDLPFTSTFLAELLPSIFTSSCFNGQKLPFSKEVRKTEIGHLFEHILLEYLCIGKVARGFSDAVFNGVTEWNFNKDGQGVFHIEIDLASQEQYLLADSLAKSIQLLNKIMESVQENKVHYTSLLHKPISQDYLFADVKIKGEGVL